MQAKLVNALEVKEQVRVSPPHCPTPPNIGPSSSQASFNNLCVSADAHPEVRVDWRDYLRVSSRVLAKRLPAPHGNPRKDLAQGPDEKQTGSKYSHHRNAARPWSAISLHIRLCHASSNAPPPAPYPTGASICRDLIPCLPLWPLNRPP